MKKSIEQRMKEVSLERLAKLYDIAKNHPFRLDRMGTSKNYGEALDMLGEEFIVLVQKAFLKSKIKCPFERWIWVHQYWTCISAINGNYKLIEEYLVMMESYLTTIHHFIETGGKLEFFYMHVGYSSYSEKQHKDNPMRALKFIFYPQFNGYDVTKLHAKDELIYYKRWLKESRKGLKEAKEKYKLLSKEAIEKNPISSTWGIEYHEIRIKWHTKRVKRLKEIIDIVV